MAQKSTVQPSKFSHKERFFSKIEKGIAFAPMSWGSPSMLLTVDRTEFQKSPREKELIINFKKSLPKTRTHTFTTILKGTY